MKKSVVFLAGVIAGLMSMGSAQAFDLSFEWGNIPRCTSGTPNRVGSPEFSVGAVPAGTAQIRFTLADQDAPYDHGGGTAAYAGGGTIAAGAFKYMSPCPPNGKHTYVWTARALDAAGKVLDTGKARKQYP